MDVRLASNAVCNDARNPVTTTSCSSAAPAAVCDEGAGLAGASCALSTRHMKITGSDVAVTIAARAARRDRLWTRCDIDFPPEKWRERGGTTQLPAD